MLSILALRNSHGCNKCPERIAYCDYGRPSPHHGGRCDRVIRLENGSISADGPPRLVLAHQD